MEVEMPQAECVRCGARYHGWYLIRNQISECEICGGLVIITSEGGHDRDDLVPAAPGKDDADRLFGS